MKKLFLFAVLVIALSNLSAQSFEKGAKVVDLRYEFGAYKTSSHDKINNTSSTGGAASKIFNGSFEYGILNWVGVGAKIQYDNYFTDVDTIHHTLPQADEIVDPTVAAFDIAAMINVHLVRKDHFDLVFGGNFGVSFFHYNVNDILDSRAKGTGSWIDFHLTPRFYFGDHIGMHLNIGYAAFNYPNVLAESSTQSSINSFSLKGSGANVGIGLQVRF